MAENAFESEVKISLVHLRRTHLSMPPLAIECKKTEQAYLPLDAVKDHQVDGLVQMERVGIVRKLVSGQGYGKNSRFSTPTPFDFLATCAGKGFVLVNFRFTKKSPRKDCKKGTNLCFALPVGQYLAAKEAHAAMGKASIPIDWFLQHATQCRRVHLDEGYGWDLSALVDGARGADEHEH